MKKISIISLIILVIDQLIKLIVINSIDLFNHIKVINKFFYIANVRNNGAAWSILAGNRWLFVILGIIAIISIYLLFIKNKKLNKLEIISYGLLIGGILGNLLDRVIHGYVIDYLEVIIIKYHYPIFNLADICIVISVILIIISSIKEEVCKKK